MFERLYENNKVIFFHFLDGFLNKTGGGNNEDTIKFIKENILIKFPNTETHKITFPELTSSLVLEGTNLNFENEHSEEYEKSYLIEYLNTNYLIISLNYDNHSTSLIIFLKDELYSIMLLNSGEGIKNHIKCGTKNMYKPYIIITTREITLIINIISLIIFYNKIKMKSHDPNFKSKFDQLQKRFKEYGILYEDFNVDARGDNIFTISASYYNTIANIFIKIDASPLHDKSIDELIIENLKTNNKIINDEKFNYIFNKIKFHYDENNIYILPQQSGSCTWFSKYWALCIYKLLYTPEEYSNFITNLFGEFTHILTEKIFTKENFEKAIENSNIVLMNNLYLKLINLNIIEKPHKYIIDIYKLPIINTKLSSELVSMNSNCFKEIKNKIENLSMIFDNLPTKSNKSNKYLTKYLTNNVFFKYICDFIHENHNKLITLEFFKTVDTNDILSEINRFLKEKMDVKLQMSDVKLQMSDDIISSILNYMTSSDNYSKEKNFGVLYSIPKFNPYGKLLDLLILFNKIDELADDNIYYKQYHLYFIIKYYIPKIDETNIIKYTNILYKIIILINVIEEILLNSERVCVINENNFSLLSKVIDYMKINNVTMKIAIENTPYLKKYTDILLEYIKEKEREDLENGNVIAWEEELKERVKTFNQQLHTKLIIINDQILNKFLEYFVNINNELFGSLAEISYNIRRLSANHVKLSEYFINNIVPSISSYHQGKYSDNILAQINEDITINIQDIDNEFNCLFNNPSYIFNNYLSKNTFDNLSLMIKININKINNNLEIKSNLLHYFLKLYIENKLIKNKLIENIKYVYLCLIHIQLLFFNCHSDITPEILYNLNPGDQYIPSDKCLSIYNCYQYRIPNINLELLDKYLYSIYKLLNDDSEQFIKHIVDNQDEVNSLDTNTDTIYKLIFKKHNIIIDESCAIESININNINNMIIKLLNINPSCFIFSVPNENNQYIYIINNNYYIKLKLNNNKIIQIEYSNHEVIRYDDVVEPFKNMIPINCFHLIYKKDGQYNITYFINNDLQKMFNPMDNILNNIQFNNNVITIRISKQNNFLPISDDIENFQMIINNYGYNSMNSIYVHGLSEHGYIITEDEYKYLTQKLESFKYDDKILFDNNDFNFITEKYKPSMDHTDFKPFNTIFNFADKVSMKDYLKPLFKLRKKIIKYSYVETTQEIKDNIKKILDIFNEKIMKTKLNLLKFEYICDNDNLEELFNYIIYTKIINALKEINETENLDSTIKILGELFNNRKIKFEYLFEYLFEFIYGYEILDEQFMKYKEIISSYVNINDDQYTKQRNKKKLNLFDITYGFREYQVGGQLKDYSQSKIRIDKFMMGKGKSAVLTPLLSLYFSIVHDKTVYIIVPSHLKKQTEKTMKQYIYFFKLTDKIIIMSDTEIKHLYLYQRADDTMQESLYKEPPKYTQIVEDSIMLIDEFDTILNPSSSNYNIKLDLGVNIEDSIIDEIINYLAYDHQTINEPTIKDEIDVLEKQLEDNILKENINWGIHPTKGFAIPFFNKDKPDLNSTFSSVIMTIFLTLYFYIEQKKKKLTNQIKNYIIHNNILQTLFKKDIFLVYDNDIKEIYNDKEELNDNKIIILKHIIDNIRLTKTQLNISFVDILIKDNIYKIGYSGTLNINYPDFNKEYDKNNDFDEIVNIKYAIVNNKTKLIHGRDIFNDKYDAYIDICGRFKDNSNEDIARELNTTFHRPVIFIDELDVVNFINNEKVDIYNDNILTKPIFYYDQSHIIGIDIKQEKYPSLKGLCIIDDKTKYTEIAQGIFRLGKINFGHSIDIYIKNEEINDKHELFKKLVENDEKDKKNKENLLNFQTYKAIVRNTSESSEHLNKEVVKYYFNETVSTTIEDLLKDICKYDKKKLGKLNLNDLDEVRKLIYNIGSLVSQTATEIEQERKQEMKQETQTGSISGSYLEYQLNFKKILIKLLPEVEDYLIQPGISFNYEENDGDDDIYILPNIFTFNFTGLVFILIGKKLLLVPGHMIKRFYNKYAIFNIYLIQINQINQMKYDRLVIDGYISKYKLFDIILNDSTDKIADLDYNCKYVLLIIILNHISDNNFKIKLDLVLELIPPEFIDNPSTREKKYKFPPKFIENTLPVEIIKKYICDLSYMEYDNVTEKYEYKLDRFSNVYNYNVELCENREKLVSSIITDSHFRKYIKYKNKYIKYKNNLIYYKSNIIINK